MATWKLAPALAAGNAVVLKPAEQTPASILYLMSLIGDLLPPGVVNVVNGFGAEAGKPLASSNRIAKIAFTGETTTGRLVMQYASQNLIPVTLELGGKSPNIFFKDVVAEDDDFFDKAIEGFVMFALNQGEVCTCPSRALIHEKIYDRFMERALKRVEAIVQDEIFGPVVSVTTFKDDDEALSIANDTLYGLGAGIWSRDANRLYRFGRAIQAGRVWTNCYHAYPAHAAFGGYKQSGIGRENHLKMLDHYQQTKNMLVSYSPKKLGFF